MVMIRCKCGREYGMCRDVCACGNVLLACLEHSDCNGAQWEIGSPCSHRGESTRSVECNSCRGRVRVKVFACDLHEECTIKKRAGELKTCLGCTDHAIS